MVTLLRIEVLQDKVLNTPSSIYKKQIRIYVTPGLGLERIGIFKGKVEEYSLCSLHCTYYKHVLPRLMKTMVCMYI